MPTRKSRAGSSLIERADVDREQPDADRVPEGEEVVLGVVREPVEAAGVAGHPGDQRLHGRADLVEVEVATLADADRGALEEIHHPLVEREEVSGIGSRRRLAVVPAAAARVAGAAVLVEAAAGGSGRRAARRAPR